MTTNELIETRHQVIWLTIAGVFGLLVNFKGDVGYWIEISSAFTLISAALICRILRHIIMHNNFSPNLFTISFGACLFCSISAFHLTNQIAATITLAFTIGIGLLIFNWSNSDNMRVWLSEFYVTILIIVIGGCLSIIPTFVLNNSPFGCKNIPNSISDLHDLHDLLDCSTHIFPLTLTSFSGLLFGSARGYLILMNKSHIWHVSLKRFFVILIVFILGLILAYKYPRGWIKEYVIVIDSGWLMIFLAISYIVCIGILPLVTLYRFKKIYINMSDSSQKVLYICLSLIGGFLQGIITVLCRYYFQRDFKCDFTIESFGSNIVIDTIAAAIISVGFVLSISWLMKFDIGHLFIEGDVGKSSNQRTAC